MPAGTCRLCAEDNQLGALMVEIHHSGRAMNVLAAMAVQALDFAHLSADLGGDVQKWLDESVMAQTPPRMSGTAELGGEDNFGACLTHSATSEWRLPSTPARTAAGRAPITSRSPTAVPR
jgi:hypothetical protein